MRNGAKLCRWGMAAMLFCAAIANTTSASIIQTAEFAGNTYYLLAPAWWEQSEAEAQSLGGHLVTINNLAEHNFVYDTFGTTALANSPSAGKVNLWIGMCDPTLDGSYQWCDDSPVDYMNFFTHQPQRNYDDEMFMGIRVRGSSSSVPVGRWIDIVGDARLGDLNYGVVEVTPVPEPTAWMLIIAGIGCLVAGKAAHRSRMA